MTSLAELPTPSLLLDRVKLDANIDRMRRHLAPLGVPLRPHAKTAKCIEVIRLALHGQPGGITVSTLAEARAAAAAGIGDILYAVGIVPAKLPEIAALRRGGTDLSIILDDPEAARAVAAFAAEEGTLPTLIEIDSDGHRAGLRPDDPRLIETARILHHAGPGAFRGVMTHAGGSYDCRGEAELRAAARQEREALVAAAARLETAGLPCPARSAGSTPTALFAESAEGLTEIRAGVYMFQDLVMAGLGVCRIEEIALSVLVSVIGRQEEKGLVVTDGGWMALSRDRGTAAQAVDQRYGLVCDLDGAPIDDLIVTAANQEHGLIGSRGGAAVDLERFPIGRLLRVLPNHACATAAQHQGYQVVESGAVVARWPRFGGW